MLTYSKSGILTERDIRLQKEHWLFIDLGAYRTTVLCWPQKKNLRDISVVSRYLVSHQGSELPGYPSAFMKEGLEFEFLTEQGITEVSKDDYIRSAKSFFAEEYTRNKGIVDEFSHFVRHLLKDVFNRIIQPEPESPWNYKEIPAIMGVKLTVPDLFIENLREGYCKTIHNVCKELYENDERWKMLLPDIGEEDFVQITADENGTGELYLIHVLQNLPFIDLSHQDDREINFSDVSHFFQTFPSPDKEKKLLRIACCVIDIGGLTTDASISLLEVSPSTDTHELEAHLMRKNSFSEDRAGQYFQEKYVEHLQEKRGHNCQNKNWWECESFLKAYPLNFLPRIIEEQYRTVTDWKKNTDIDGLYFVLAGRPTQAPAVQSLLLNLILDEFNKDELLLMKEQCIFMSNYPHIWRENNLRYARIDPELAKLVTVVGNLFTLQPAGYEVSEDIVSYYVRVETGRRHQETITLSSSDSSQDLQNYPLFRHRLERGNSIDLSFSKNRAGKYEPFMTVSSKLGGQDLDLYPKLRIGSLEHAKNRWILPSILVENLVDEQAHKYFSLRWEQEQD